MLLFLYTKYQQNIPLTNVDQLEVNTHHYSHPLWTDNRFGEVVKNISSIDDGLIKTLICTECQKTVIRVTAPLILSYLYGVEGEKGFSPRSCLAESFCQRPGTKPNHRQPNLDV